MKRRLHLVRSGEGIPSGLLDDRDWVVYLDTNPNPLRLDPRGEPPIAPGSITHDQLVTLLFAADLVVTW